MSVDPVADKYPGVSPYAYCAWNPILFIDPNGEEKVKSLGKDDKDRKIAKAADNFENNEPVIHLWAHGNPDRITIYTNTRFGFTKGITSSQDLEEFLKKTTFVYTEFDDLHIEIERL